MFGQILLLLVVIYCTYSFIKTFPDQYRDVKRAILFSAGVWLTGQIYYSVGLIFESFVRDASTITSLSILLVSFLMFIRELKPNLFRYPYPVVFVPMLVPFSYILVYDTLVMRNTILYSVALIVIVVHLLLVIGYKTNYSLFIKGVGAGALLFLAYIYIMLSETFIYNEFIWHIIVSVGLILCLHSVIGTFNRKHHQEIA